MNKIITLMGLLVSCSYVAAQDVIVKTDGSTVLAKVIKVGDKEVEYKKFNSTSDRVYSISVENLQSINYEDGEVEKFSSKAQTITSTSSSNVETKMKDATPAANNSELINLYNEFYSVTNAETTKNAKSALAFLGVDSKSVLSTSDIEIKLIYQGDEYKFCSCWSIYHCGGVYQINITNKSENTIYLNMEKSYRISNDGDYKSYFNSKVISTSSSSGNGSIGLFGTSSSSASAVGTTYTQDRIIPIPPHGSKNLTEFKAKCVKSGHVIIGINEPMPGEKYEENSKCLFNHCIQGLYEGDLKINQAKKYTLENTPAWQEHHIIYSTDKNFATATAAIVTTYIKELVGLEDKFKCRTSSSNSDQTSYYKKLFQKNFKNIDKGVAIYRNLELQIK